jgi:hypothetical protein
MTENKKLKRNKVLVMDQILMDKTKNGMSTNM